MLSEASGPSYSVPSLVYAQNSLGAEAELWSVESDPLSKSTKSFHRTFEAIRGVPLLSATHYSPQFAKAVKTEKTDVFHTHGLWLMPNVEPARLRKDLDSIFVLTVRGMLSPAAVQFSKQKKMLFWQALQKRAVKAASFLHATAPSELDEVRQFGIENPVAVIPNGIHIPKPVDAKPSGHRRTILSLGRLHPKKNLAQLISDWATLEAEFEDWQLRIIGPDENNYKSTLQEHVKKLGLSRVSIEDPLFGEEKNVAYRSADVFVLPSLNENFALTVAEALAAGTPVISSTGAPWQEMVERQCGWWVPLSDGGFRAAMREAVSATAEARSIMGQNGREWMIRDFGWDAIAERMLWAYRWARGEAERPDFVYD